MLSRLIHEYPEKPWNWCLLSRNPNITMQIVLDYPEKPWNWYLLSYNPNITMQNVIDYPENPWNWQGLSNNPNITMQNVIDYPEKEWDISSNPNITYKFVVEHINKINFGVLSDNRLKRHPIVRTRLRAIAKPLVYRTHVNLIPPLAEKVLDFLYDQMIK